MIINESRENLQIEVKNRIERLEEIEQFFKSNPLKEIVQLRLKFIKSTQEHVIESNNAIQFAKDVAEKEKELFKQAELRIKNYRKIMDEQQQLRNEISQLNWLIENMNMRGIL